MSDTEARSIDPHATYTLAELARVVEPSRWALYQLCKKRKLRHSRTGPSGGRIKVAGQWWLNYLKRTEVAPEGEDGEPSPPRSGRKPAKREGDRAPSPRPRREAGPGRPDPMAELREVIRRA